MGENDGLLKMPEQLGGTVSRPVSLSLFCSLSHFVMVVVFFCFWVGGGGKAES